MLLLLVALLAPNPTITVEHLGGADWQMRNAGAADIMFMERFTIAAHDSAGVWPARQLYNCGNYPYNLVEAGGASTFTTTDLDRRPPGRYTLAMLTNSVESSSGALIDISIEQRRAPIAIEPLLGLLDTADKHACWSVAAPVAAFFTTEATSAEVKRVGRHLADRSVLLWHGFAKGTLDRLTWLAEWTDRLNRLDPGREQILLGLLNERLAQRRSLMDSGGYAEKQAVIDNAANPLTGAAFVQNLQTMPVWNERIEFIMAAALAKPSGTERAKVALRARAALLPPPAREALIKRVISMSPEFKAFAHSLADVKAAPPPAPEDPRCADIATRIDRLLVVKPRTRTIDVTVKPIDFGAGAEASKD